MTSRLLPVVCLTVLWAVFLALGLGGVLIPPLAALVIIFLLLPHRQEPWALRTIVSVTGLALIWLLSKVQAIVWIAGIGLGGAYLLNPAVNWLEKRGVGRSRASLIMVLPALAFVASTGFLVVPRLFGEAADFLGELPAFVATLSRRYNETVRDARWDSLPIDISSVTGQLTATVQAMISGAGQKLVDVARRTGTVLSILLLAPVVGYHFLKDLPVIQRNTLALLPRRMEGEVDGLIREMDTLVGRYFRGQLLISLIVAVLTSAGLIILGLPYGALIGVLAGVLNMVPIVGYWISLILALLVALSTSNPVQNGLVTAAIFFGIQLVEQNFLSPRIVGEQTGLHPVAVLLCLLVFTSLAGLAGALLAIPFTLFIRLFYRRYVARPIREAEFLEG